MSGDQRTLWLATLCCVGFATSTPATAQHLGPLACGEISYVGGIHVWTDYVFDDLGKNKDGKGGGEELYPGDSPAAEDPTGGLIAGPRPDRANAADFVQLQIGLTPTGEVAIAALLHALVDPAVPEVAVGFDTDRSSATGGNLPGNYWIPGVPIGLASLGLERLVVLSSAGGRVLAYNALTLAWDQAGEFPASVDAGTDVVRGTVPLSLLDPDGATWNAVGVAGVRAPFGTSFLDGGPIFDLAYVKGDDPFANSSYAAVDAGLHFTAGTDEWQDHLQADILAGLADRGQAITTIDFARIAAGDTDLAATEAVPGSLSWHTRLYVSTLRVGDGVHDDIWGGVYHPYLVRLPAAEALPSPPPLILFMTGLGQNHMQNGYFFSEDPNNPLGTFDPPAIVIFPLPRLTCCTNQMSEFAMFEALDDAIATFSVPEDRVYLSGLSGGGLGTFYVGTHFPDRFAGAFSIIGSGETRPLENLLNLPVRFHNGQFDPLIPAEDAQATVDRLMALGTVDFRSWILHEGSHTPVPNLSECAYLELLARERVRDPARVVYSFDPAQFVDEPVQNFVVHYDSAYWVSGLSSCSGASATIDATSLAHADRQPSPVAFAEIVENATTPRDFCGPGAGKPQTSQTWNDQGTRLEPGPAQPVSNALEIALTNVASFAIDVSRTGVDLGDHVAIRVTGDCAGVLTVAGLAPGTLVEFDGASASAGPDGRASVAYSAGENEGLIDDGDGVATGDNCPAISNPDQADRGGVATTTPDGIGDACQCGDVTGNGIVNGQDANAIKRHGLGAEPNPLFAVPGNCDVTGNGVCNGQDASAVTRAALGQPSPSFGQNCHNASGTPVPPEL